MHRDARVFIPAHGNSKYRKEEEENRETED